MTFPRKPTWMVQSDWRALLAMCGGVPSCTTCGSEECLEVDHVVPRAAGGTNDVSNLQFLCRSHNLDKSAKPSEVWADHRGFYWDGPFFPDKCRTSQREGAYEAIVSRPEHFVRSFSNIGGVMYLLAWIVGAGKTLAIPVLAFALNEVIRRYGHAGQPRVRRVLVLTKETALRDQIAGELRTEIVKYGIAGGPPRVGVVTDGSMFSEGELSKHDLVVSCVQMLWSQGDVPRPDLVEVLARFEMIVVDEPHFALKQALGLVASAHRALVFGLTGSPITASGNTLRHFALLSVYGYRDAHENDGALKYLDAAPEMFSKFVRVLGIEEAEIAEQDRLRKTASTDEQGYPQALVPVISVTCEVLKDIHKLDDALAAGGWNDSVAFHRRVAATDAVEATFSYPPHAMISVDSIEDAKSVIAYLHAKFQREPDLYPRELGYWADRIDSDSESLHPDHPWLLARNNNGALSVRGANGVVRYASRILVVVGMGREGINNSLCCLVGIARTVRSVIEVVQRGLGRQLRSCLGHDAAGQVKLPPAMLDTVKIITHAAFENEGTIRQAISFIMDMSSFLEPIPTIEALEHDHLPSLVDGVDADAALTDQERLHLAIDIGKSVRTGQVLSDALLFSAYDHASPKKREEAMKWRETLLRDPRRANQVLRHAGALAEIPRVMRETPDTTPSVEELKRWAMRQDPLIAIAAAQVDDNEPLQKALRGFYRKEMLSYHRGPLVATTCLNDQQKRMGAEVLERLARGFEGPRSQAFVHAANAFRMILGIPLDRNERDEYVCSWHDWDIPQCHALLNRYDVWNDIRGYVRWKLIVAGYCPNLSALLEEENR